MYRPPSEEPLAFRLQKSVRYILIHDFQPVVISRFPLRIVYLHRIWQPVMECLASGDWVSFGTIRRAAPNMAPEVLESVLSELVHDRILEFRGLPSMDDTPFVSILIAFTRRTEDLAACLRSLSRLEYPENRREILITGPVPDEARVHLSVKFPEVRFTPSAADETPAQGRNRGAAKSSGEILAFVDAHCLIHPVWLKELIPAFRNPAVGTVSGGTDLYYEFSELDHYVSFANRRDAGEGFRRVGPHERLPLASTCNLLVRRTLFENLEGFRQSLDRLSEIDFVCRLQKTGYALEYRPNGKVIELPRNRIPSFFMKHFVNGASEPLLQGLHPEKIKRFVLPKTGAVFWLLMAAAVAAKSFSIAGLSAVVMVTDTAVTYTHIRRRRIPLGIAPLALAVMKSYGLFLYYTMGFVSRHYLVIGLLLGHIFPAAGALTLFMHLAAGTADYVLKMPDIGLISFFFYFSIEQIAYQLGLWYGCLRRSVFNPLFPKLSFQKSLWLQEAPTDGDGREKYTIPLP